MKYWWIWRHELYEEYVGSYEEYEDRNCMKNMFEVIWIWRHALYEVYIRRIWWSYKEYEDMNCMKNMYEVMKNMKTGIVWRICMNEVYEDRIWRHELYEDELYEEYV